MTNKLDKNIENDIVKDLEKVGLDKVTAITYMSLLRLGEVGSSKIITDTGLHGQTVYNSLEKLEEQNLAEHVIVNGRKRFIARKPDFLSNLLEEKKKIADGVAKKLEQFFSYVDTQEIQVFRGNESFIKVQFDSLKELDADSELLIFGGDGDQYVKNMSNNMHEYEYQRNKKSIGIRYIGGEKQRVHLENSASSRKLFSYKLLPDAFSGVTNITVLGKVGLAIFLFDQNVNMILIKNKKIAQSYIDFFETLWKMGK